MRSALPHSVSALDHYSYHFVIVTINHGIITVFVFRIGFANIPRWYRMKFKVCQVKVFDSTITTPIRTNSFVTVYLVSQDTVRIGIISVVFPTVPLI